MKLLFIIIFAALLISACGNPTTTDLNAGTESNSPTTAETPDKFASARSIYSQNCSACHGINGEGMEAGSMKYPSLREGHALEHKEADLAALISNGKGGMPPFKDSLKKEEIDQLVRFITEELQKEARK
jgi:cytochrome c551